MNEMMRRSRNTLAFFGAVCALAMSGCGSGDRLGLVSVSGVVTLDGRPLPNARVVFYPAGGGRLSHASTNSDGAYELQYTEGKSGALPDKHKVTISTFIEADPDSPDSLVKTGQKESIPAKYNVQSTLQADLSDGHSEVLGFDLTSS